MTQEQYRKFVKNLKTDKGITYKHIAKQLEISYVFLNLWLNQERNFSAQTIERLDNYLKQERMFDNV